MIRKLLHTGKPGVYESAALFLGRLIFGGLMLTHGYPKLQGFSQRMDTFPDPLGLGSPVSLGLTVFAEFFCAILLMLGLGTRLASIPLIITMAVVAFVIHGPDPLGKKEMALLYLAGYILLLIFGPGRFSVDKLISK